MQPTYANAGGGQGAAANKENANTGGKGGGGDTEPKENPMYVCCLRLIFN